MRIVFAGTPQAAVPSLMALQASRHEIVAVLTRADAPSGRGRTVTSSPVAVRARTAGLPVLQPKSVRTPEFLAALTELAPDAAAVVAYGKLLPQPVLDVPRHGWVNLHFSLLPAWRGAAPVHAAIRAGDQVTGASTFQLEAGLDTGPVYGVVTEQVRPRDTEGELLTRLADGGAGLLVATLDGIEDGSLVARPQPADGISVIGKVTAADARINWSEPAISVDRLIRSVSPAPGAWTDSPWGRMILGPIAPLDPTAGPSAADPGPAALAPGELLVQRRRVLVGTGTVAMVLGTVTPPGRKPMPAADWGRGARPGPGTGFGSAPTDASVGEVL